MPPEDRKGGKQGDGRKVGQEKNKAKQDGKKGGGGISTVAQWLRIPLVSMRMWVQSLAWLSRLRLPCVLGELHRLQRLLRSDVAMAVA